MKKRNIALVGCGAIAQIFYLPAIARMRENFGSVWLVDPSDRAIASATSIVSDSAACALAHLPANIDLVIIATPNKLHVSVAQEVLARGADVLVEKPFATWPQEAYNLVQTAANAGKILAVNQTRRFLPYVLDLRQRISAGELGALRSIRHHEGYKLSWPFESGAAFHKTAQRTGVIMDFGVHVLDFYEYLLQPKWELSSAIHDGFNGPEGLAEIELRANGAPVLIRLSRYQKQENLARLTFENSDIEIDLDGLNAYSIRDRSGSVRRINAFPAAESYNALADMVLTNFINSANGLLAPVCPAVSSLPVIDLLDQIYRSARLYPQAIGAV